VLVEYNTKEGSYQPLPEGRERDPRKVPKTTVPEPKETAMNAIASSLYRDLTCAAAAVLISLVIGASFVQSTATAPATATAVTLAARQA
jgi:hypothetical protein